jgi:quinol monooxygenase YgiN
VEHLHKHLAQPHMDKFREQIADMRESSELRVVQPV